MTRRTRDSHDGEAGPTVAAVIYQLVVQKLGRYVLVIDAGSGTGSFLKWSYESYKRDGRQIDKVQMEQLCCCQVRK